MGSPRQSALGQAKASARFSAPEWEARVQLAALYRAMHQYGMTDLIYNHITLRVPDEPEHILINPFGLMYKEITASSLIKMHMSGEVLYRPDGEYGLNPAGYIIHTAIHRARSDAHCVLHTHSRAGSAVSAMACGLLPLSQHSHMFLGRIGYHDFSGPVVDPAQQAQLVGDLGSHDALMMRNHGLLVTGETVGSAFFNIYWLESACRIHVDALRGGEPQMPDAPALETSRRVFAKHAGAARGAREWAAVLRDLDRIDPSFRD